MQSWCESHGEEPVTDLQRGSDFRHPRYRQETFLRFYEFHTRTCGHPGGVYHLLPWLAERFGWTLEQRLWFAFLEGNSQHPITALKIFERFPEGVSPGGVEAFSTWVDSVYTQLAYDTDRRYHRKALVKSVACYADLVSAAGSQEALFMQHCGPDERANFAPLWDLVSKKFFSFGRLSSFSYLEYLRLSGIPVECDRLFLEDMSGSKSHRNGLCKVLGWDHLDWRKDNEVFPGAAAYKPLLGQLAAYGEELLQEARRRMPGDRNVTLFTLESALCAFKGWYRPNRRYPNVYNDMFRDRIEDSERRWNEPMPLWWQARQECLPRELRCEDVPGDPGLVRTKQNHFRLTGEVLMMDERCGGWACFNNDFNTALWNTL